MPVPSVYTEEQLMAYMRTVLGATATVLGWTDLSPYQEPLNETLLAYGVDSIANATDIQKLRALARVAVWRAVVDATAGNTDFRMGDQSITSSQIHAQATQNLRRATIQTKPYDSTYAVSRTAVIHSSDPYRTIETT